MPSAHPQVLVIASVMLMIGSLSSVAVPRLSGQLIDISINYAQSGEEAKAKQQANGDARCVICLRTAVLPEHLRAPLCTG